MVILNSRAFMLVLVPGLILKIRFWGIFWINARSHITAPQGFLEYLESVELMRKIPRL